MEHGVHDSLGFLRVFVLHEFAQDGGNDLPGEAEFVFQPAALDFLTADGEFLPIVIDFLLRLAIDDEGEGFGELEVRAAVQGDEFLAIELELDGHDRALWPAGDLGPFFAIGGSCP